jgi:hypothetical protein
MALLMERPGPKVPDTDRAPAVARKWGQENA